VWTNCARRTEHQCLVSYCWPVQEFSILCGTWRFIVVFTKVHYLSLSWARWILCTVSCECVNVQTLICGLSRQPVACLGKSMNFDVCLSHNSSSRRWTSFSWKFWPSQWPLSIFLDPGHRLVRVLACRCFPWTGSWPFAQPPTWRTWWFFFEVFFL